MALPSITLHRVLLYALISFVLLFIAPSLAGPAKAYPLSESLPLSMSDNFALKNRGVFLALDDIAWWLNHDGIRGSLTLEEASVAGFMPFWINSPVDGSPIVILRSIEPRLDQVGYWPIADTGWDLSMAPPSQVTDTNAHPLHSSVDESTFPNWLTASNGPLHNDKVSQNISEAPWDAMIWDFSETALMIMDGYLMDHSALPTTFSAMLDRRYFVNDDWLTRSSQLIKAGKCGDFHMTVSQEKDTLYFDYIFINGAKVSVAYKYSIDENGIDVTSLTHRVPISDDGKGARIVLVSKDMIPDPPKWLSDDDHKPLSSFYVQ